MKAKFKNILDYLPIVTNVFGFLFVINGYSKITQILADAGKQSNYNLVLHFQIAALVLSVFHLIISKSSEKTKYTKITSFVLLLAPIILLALVFHNAVGLVNSIPNSR